MKQLIVITGASSGFGAPAARELSKAGHTVYPSMRETTTRSVPQVEAVKKFGHENNVDLGTVELDVTSQDSADDGAEVMNGVADRVRKEFSGTRV
jgi:NADP-dependent 3-hydroxy acid dehydrogenase YdfG